MLSIRRSTGCRIGNAAAVGGSAWAVFELEKLQRTMGVSQSASIAKNDHTLCSGIVPSTQLKMTAKLFRVGPERISFFWKEPRVPLQTRSLFHK